MAKNAILDREELRAAARNLSLTCGILGLIGCFAVIIAQVVGLIVVEDHNPISETISKLAIGEYAWIQDIGLDFFGAAAIACGVGLYAWNLGDYKWKLGALALVVIGIVVILIAEHNQYAGRPGRGANIHIYLVNAFGLLFGLSSFLLSFGLQRIDQVWQRFSLGTAVAWLILAPIFFVIPTSWDGAYERILGLIVLLWTVAIARLLIKRGTGDLTADST